VWDQQLDNPTVVLGLARCWYELGEFESARALLDEFLATQPDHAVALADRVKLALTTGQPAEAEQWLRRAVAVAPNDPDVLYPLVQCLQHVGKTEEAKTWLARFQKIETDLKRVVEATRAITRRPEAAGLRCEVGQLILQNGQEEEGLRWLHSALQEDPAHAPTLQTLADYYESKGQPQLAEGYRTRARRIPVKP
jgi:predicted Zn-dependent protease